MTAPVTPAPSPLDVNTGPTSVSFWVALLAHLSGLTGMGFTAFHAGTWSAPSDAVIGGGGALLAAGAAVVKIWHDKGVRAAAAQAHADIQSSDLQADARADVRYLEQFGPVKQLAEGAGTAVVNLDKKVTDFVDNFVPKQDQAALEDAAEVALRKVIAGTALAPFLTSPAPAASPPGAPAPV